jgi:hypothetical protein
VKTTIIVLSVAALIASAPAVFAQGVPGKTPGLQHKVSSYAPPRAMHANGAKKGYPRAFGYAPDEVLDRETEITRKAGGGGGGGGGGM